MGSLFIVATPIGNLDDLSPRALKTLETVDLIACEDTRRALKLLTHFGVRKPLASYHEFNEREKASEIGRKLEAGENVALISDAGTPAISDPGFRLVRYCREHGIPVISIPGPNAAVAALAASGIPSDEFLFVGFLPSRRAARRSRLEALRTGRTTMVFYEAPHRIFETIDDMIEILGDREACVGREITKAHEEYVYGPLSKARATARDIGEFVLVVAGAKDEPAPKRPLTREDALKILGISRNELYDLFFKK
ncbi:MAG TPA: 16S rRNA (cytidine(1402)-2'-O)-methyltransferase [Terriglobia bacterium]|nr:16S rRNA (cytidine(1402)-2'-O)-methyltransferase [Terriglobia bacterium]